LAQGELARQELEAGGLSAPQLELARQALRQATTFLESLDKELKTDIPQRRRASPRAGELSADELTSLAQQIQHQLARAQRNRALLFDHGSDDRLSLLLAACDTLQRALTQMSRDEPLKADVQLDLAACQRLLGRYAQAAELTAELDQEGIEPTTRVQARAEMSRVALAGNHFEAAKRLIDQGRVISGQASPELDFAWFEAFLAFARAARQGQQPFPNERMALIELAKKYELEAADTARLLEETH